jgi:hypothetical protein
MHLWIEELSLNGNETTLGWTSIAELPENQIFNQSSHDESDHWLRIAMGCYEFGFGPKGIHRRRPGFL